MKATLNFATINNDALTMISNCHLAIHTLAASERELKRVREDLKKSGKTPEEIKEQTVKERNAVKADKERATTMCELFIMRNISTADAISGELYHFDVEAFLRNIGVLTGDEVDNKAIKKVEDFRDVVVDRVQCYVARRKKGEDKLSCKDQKSIKNNPIDLVLAIGCAMVASKAVEYAGGGLVVKKFD